MFRKRFIALVMALTMLLTLIAPSFAWALEGDGTDGDGDPAIVNPDPVADPEPDPDPDPVADPEPDPDPDPVADPEPDPDPDPVVNPDPDPDPVDDLGDPDDPAPDPDPQAPATRSILEDGWYVIGLRGWAVSDLSADDKFEGPNADGVYTLEKELLANSEFKAVKVEHDAITQWYPVGEGNNQGNGDNPGLFTIYLKVDSFLRPSKVPSTVANGFHLNGTFNNWNLATVEQLSGSGSDYYIDKTFTEETRFKVINNYYGDVTWYPASGDGITVSAGHYRITFDGSNAPVATRYCTITWNNDDGSVIDTTEVLADDFPEHSDPRKDGYHFAGWDPERQFASGDATYTAVFHQLTEHTAKEATCTETGNKAYWSCAECDNVNYKDAYGTEEADTNYIVVPALDHNYVPVAVTAPTCVEGGYTTYTCSRCGDSYRVNETSATGIHVWGDPAWGIPQNDGSGWTVTVTFTCNTCSAPATRHAQLVGDVTTVPATCVARGYKQATFETNPDGQQRFAETITWDQTEGPDASAHPTSLEAHAAVPATCTEAGNSAYWYCPTCEKYFSDAEGNTTIAENSWVIPALAVTVVDDENGGFTASIPAGYFTSDETDHEPTVTREAATIVFNSHAKTAIAGAAGENPVSLSVATSTNEGVMTVTIEMTANNAAVFENPGEDAFATVTVPFALGQGMVPVVNLVVNGERTPVEVLDYSNTSVTFRAKHFSVYEVSQEEQLGSEIHIDESYFPDKAFRNYVSDHVDGHIGDQTFEKDGYLSAAEIVAVKSINIPYGCKDVTGITIFSAVEEITFVATYSAFPTLDVSSFKHLKSLGGYMNFDLTSIVFGPNNSSTLKKLFIDHFQGNSLDLSSLSALEELRLVQCPNLTSVDVSNCTNLVQIGVGCCDKVTSLDVSHNLQLKHLSVDYGALTTLDVSRNEKLTTLACNDNQLTSLDLSNNPLLERLDCSNNSLTDLNIDNNTKLWALKYAGNEFNTVSVSKETLKSLIVGTDTWFGVYPTLIAKEDTTIGPINIHTGDKVSFEEVYSTGLYDATHRNGKKLVITNSNSSTYYYVIAMGMGVNAQFSVFDDSAVQMDKANADNWSQIDLPSLVCSATSASGGSYAINGIALGINMVEASSENMTEGPLKEAVEAANVIAFDVYPQITLNTSDGYKSVDLSHSSALQNQSFSVTLPLGKEYANQEVTITHYNDNGTVADTWTLTADEQGYVQFTMTSFSIITVTRTGEPGYVAQIGETKYETLPAAFAAAADGDTIVMLDNSVEAGEPVLSLNGSVTLDLNGKEVTANNDIWVKTGNLTVIGASGSKITSSGYAFYVSTTSIANNVATLTINSSDVTISADGVAAIAVMPGGTVNLQAGTIKATAGNGIASNGTYSGAAINISGGVINGDDLGIYLPSGSLTVSGGTITGKTAVYVKSGTVSITDGILRGTGDAAAYSFNGNGGNPTGDALVVDNCNYPGGAPTVTISGGTFSSTNGKGIGSYAGNSMTELASVTSNNDTISIPEDEKWVAKGTNPETYDLVKKEYVAQIGETKYETLAEAFAAARPGDTITMLKDSNESATGLISLPDTTGGEATYTLDLHGKNVIFSGFTANGGQSGQGRILKITDTTVANNAEYTAAAKPGGTLYSTERLLVEGEYITIYLEKGNIYCEGRLSEDGTKGYGAVGGKKGNSHHHNLILKNGSFVVGKGNVFRAKSGSVEIINGYVEAGFEVIREASSANISGGILKSHTIITDNNSHCTNELHSDLAKNTTTLTITGGLFADNTYDNLNKYYVSSGHVAVPVEIGGTTWYKVVPAVATVTHSNKTTKYATLQEAVNAAANGDTVTLLANITLTNDDVLDVTGNYTLDLNGHTITNGSNVFTSPHDYLLAVKRGGTLTIVDSVGGGEITSDDLCVAVKLTVKGEAASGNNATLVVGEANATNSFTIHGHDYAISGNGSRGGTAVTIHGGTIVADNEAAIYQPQNGTLTIKGGVITGPAAVYVKSGEVEISGGALTGTAAAAAYSYNGDGCNPTGDALVVDSCGYPGGEPTVEISGGTFESSNAKGIGSYYGNTATTLAPVTATTNDITIPENESWVENATTGHYDLKLVTYTANLTMKDSIAVNFYIKNVSPEDVSKYITEYTFDGVTTTHTLSQDDLYPASGPNVYRFKVADVYSYQMGEEISIKVYYDGGVNPIKEITYSVSTYCHNIIAAYANDSQYTNFVALCRATLDYGAAAQIYFNGKTWAGGTYQTHPENLVNADTNPNNIVNVEMPGEAYAASRQGEITGITKYSPSLILGPETLIKLYMTGDAADVTVTCIDSENIQREVTAVVADGDRYSFKIRDIKCYELNRIFTITITKGSETVTITYSPYTYARNMWNDAGIGGLMKTMVAYGNKAALCW